MDRRQFVSLGLAVAVLPLRSDVARRPVRTWTQPIEPAHGGAVAGAPNVWPVEHTTEYDLYSNGLRIENRLQVAGEPRSYSLIHLDSLKPGPHRTQPAGIVFHTTESDQAPFESQQQPALKRIGREVLLYTRNTRAYHFVIDRFGRVHRVVVESDAANHAGHSIWADSRWIYLDLNASFLGVAFEARTQGSEDPVTEGQIRAARALTEALRARYNFAAENCVTHAQVSVNPSNMLVGWHTDWGSRFPYQEMGLPNNYEIANPSLYCFGFQYDPVYIQSTNADLRKGLVKAEERLRESAARRGIPMAAYRRILQKKYQDTQAALHIRSESQENNDEQN
jgi:hypothetical protein